MRRCHSRGDGDGGRERTVDGNSLRIVEGSPVNARTSTTLELRSDGARDTAPIMFQLQSPTPAEWLEVVFGDFDAFVADHALCERKASAMGMSLVAKYPDRSLILDPLIAFAREELEHFHVMYRIVAARGLTLPPDTRDEYVGGLRKWMKSDPEGLLLDRLLVCGVVEARGCERLKMVTEALESGALGDPELARTYRELTRAEARHHALFFRLAAHYFPDEQIRARAREIFTAEAELVARLPLRPAVH